MSAFKCIKFVITIIIIIMNTNFVHFDVMVDFHKTIFPIYLDCLMNKCKKHTSNNVNVRNI